MRSLHLSAALLVSFHAGRACPAADPFTIRGPGVRASDFRITRFASGLNYPKGMQELPDGSLLAATSDPTGTSKSFYSSTGTVVRFEDRDEDGVADGPPARLFTGLPGSLSGLKVAGKLVLVISTARQLSVLRLGATPADPLTLEGKILFNLPERWQHPPSDLAVRQAPGRPAGLPLPRRERTSLPGCGGRQRRRRARRVRRGGGALGALRRRAGASPAGERPRRGSHSGRAGLRVRGVTAQTSSSSLAARRPSASSTRKRTAAPATKRDPIARMECRELPVAFPTHPMSNGPITAANFPSML